MDQGPEQTLRKRSHANSQQEYSVPYHYSAGTFKIKITVRSHLMPVKRAITEETKDDKQ